MQAKQYEQTALSNGILLTTYRKRVKRGWTKDRASTEPINNRWHTNCYRVYMDDELMIEGTAKECADEMHYSVASLRRKARQNKATRNGIRVERVVNKK